MWWTTEQHQWTVICELRGQNVDDYERFSWLWLKSLLRQIFVYLTSYKRLLLKMMTFYFRLSLPLKSSKLDGLVEFMKIIIFQYVHMNNWTTSFTLITRLIAPDIKSGWYLLQKKFYFISIDYFFLFFQAYVFNNCQKFLLCTIFIFFYHKKFWKSSSLKFGCEMP